MKGDRLPGESNLALHCQPNAFLERDSAGNPTGVSVDAFRVDEDGISTNWIEYQGGDFLSVCEILSGLRTVRKTHRVGIMRVSAIEEVGNDTNVPLRAEHDPVDTPKANPGHALIVGVAPTNDEVLLALTTVVELRAFAVV